MIFCRGLGIRSTLLFDVVSSMGLICPSWVMLVVISIFDAVGFLGFQCDPSLSLVVINVPLRTYGRSISVFDLARS